jgi:hypothetical protein
LIIEETISKSSGCLAKAALQMIGHVWSMDEILFSVQVVHVPHFSESSLMSQFGDHKVGLTTINLAVEESFLSLGNKS